MVEDDVRAHLMAVKIRHRDKLKAVAKELEKDTVKLKAQVFPSRKRIAETRSKIQEKRLKLSSVSGLHKVWYNSQVHENLRTENLSALVSSR